MAQSWHERLRVWKEDAKDKLAKKWWLWPVLLVWQLISHAIYSSTNEFISAHRKLMYNAAKAIVGHIPSDPVTLTVIIAVFIVAGLVVHSYFDTREKPPIKSTVGLTTLDVYFERSTNPKVNYKSKLRIVLKNDSGQGIGVRVPSWITEAGDVPIQWPPASTLQAESSDGWERDSWQGESRELNIPPGRVFRVWIGLNPSVGDDELRRRHETRRLGILVLPVNISGHDDQFTTRL